MTVYIVLYENWDETDIEGVFPTMESAQSNYPKYTFVRCGDGVEAMGLSYGSRLVIEPHEVHE